MGKKAVGYNKNQGTQHHNHWGQFWFISFQLIICLYVYIFYYAYFLPPEGENWL